MSQDQQIHTSIHSFAEALPGRGVLFGLDLGTKTIGLSVSDTEWMVASPLPVWSRRKFSIDADSLVEMITVRSVCGLIMGLPLNMDGTEGPRAQSTRDFVRNFSKKTALPFTFWDERLSTAAAEKAMLEGDLTRKKRAKRVDSLAATLILQSALDFLRNQ